MKKGNLFSRGNVSLGTDVQNLNVAARTAKKENYMKKVALLVMTAILLSLVFGCGEQPSDITSIKAVKYNTLDAPASVTAKAYGPTGYIRVSWDAVPNAVGYLVYRKSVDNGMVTVKVMNNGNIISGKASGVIANLYIEDIAGLNNPFKTDVNYSYKVVAISDWSSNPSVGVGSSWGASNVDEWVALQNNSKDSNTVSFPKNGKGDAALLAQGSKLAKPVNFKVAPKVVYPAGSLVNNYKEEYLEATWTAEPGVTYQLAVGVPDGLPDNSVPMKVIQTYAASGNNITGTVEIGRVVLPSIYGGKVRVEIVAKHGLPVISSNQYYADSEPYSEDLTLTQTTLNTPASLIAAIADDEDGYQSKVKLTWTKVYGADSYKVYRFISNVGSYLPASGNPYFVYDSWKEVTANILYDAELHAGDGIYLSAVDTLVTEYDPSSTENIYYMVVAVKGTDVSLPRISTAVTRTLTYHALNAQHVSWDNVAKSFQGIRVWWSDVKNGEKFVLSRIELQVSESGEAIGTVGAWSDVPDANIVKDITGQWSLVDTGVTVRKSYRYRLVTTYAEKKTISYTDYSTYPYINQIRVPLIITNNTHDMYDDKVFSPPYLEVGTPSAYELGVKINVTSIDELRALLQSNESIRISRLKVFSDGRGLPGTIWMPRWTLTAAQLSDKYLIDTFAAADTGLYKYQAEIVIGTAVSVKNASGNDGITAVGTPSSDATYVTRVQLPNPTTINPPATAGTLRRFSFHLGGEGVYGEAIKGATFKIYYMKKQAGIPITSAMLDEAIKTNDSALQVKDIAAVDKTVVSPDGWVSPDGSNGYKWLEYDLITDGFASQQYITSTSSYETVTWAVRIYVKKPGYFSQNPANDPSNNVYSDNVNSDMWERIYDQAGF